MIIQCPCCQKEVDLPIGKINRANKMGLKLFCSRVCSGLNRRIERTEDQKKLIKAEYDKEYRTKNTELLKKKHHEYFKKTYDKQKAAVERQKGMPKHVEYCRQPKYKEYKKQYDVGYRAKKLFGEFWESAILILKIEAEYDQREIRQINNLHNKSQKRKRQWQQLKKNNYLHLI